MITPPDTFAAVSIESARRLRYSSSSAGFATSRSTTISIVCFFCLSSSGGVVEVDHLAVDARAQEPLLDHLGHLLLVLALLAGDVGREDDELAFPAGRREGPVDHLLDRLGLDRPAAFRAVWLADRRVEQAQVVVDLRDGADGRARVLRRRPLLDRDRRRESLDRVDVRLLHLLEELPRVGGERLDVAALALGEDGVEGERRLARARDSGDDDEPVARNVEGDVLEVVLTRAADAKEVHGEGDSKRSRHSPAPPRKTSTTLGPTGASS